MPTYKSTGADLPRLKRSQLQSENLASEAFTAVLSYLGKGGDYDAKAKALPPQWRAVYTTCRLDDEVNNGGHHQFFWNSDGALNKETLEDLTYIGAEPFVPIFRDALAVYDGKDYPAEKQSAGNNWEAFTQGYRDKRLEDCDNRFYKINKSIYDYVADYIRSNPDLYCDP